MAQRRAVQPQVRRFYDGGLSARAGRPERPPDPDREPRIVLARLSERGVEVFAMQRRIAYRDRWLGELLVPGDVDTFRTDLTSVPTLFTWLVPKTGAHLPAALLHDGLVHPPGTRPTYRSTDGHRLTRVQADRVFRDAMADTGTGLVRRWLVWAAVTTATIVSREGASPVRARAWAYRVASVVTLALIGYLGYSATLDLFDVTGPAAVQVPWMADRPLLVELAGGLAAAVVVPLLLGLAWGRFRVAGWIVGTTLAVLLHATLALAAITGLYWSVERLARWNPTVAAGLGLAVVAASAAVVGVLVTGLVG